MRTGNFWDSVTGQFLIIFLTLAIALSLTFLIARVNVVAEAGLLFPLLLTVTLVIITRTLRGQDFFN